MNGAELGNKGTDQDREKYRTKRYSVVGFNNVRKLFLFVYLNS